MHQVIFGSSIRRMRHVANKQKDLCRSLSSTTNITTTTRGTPNNNNNPNGNSSNTKNGTVATPFSSAATDTATSRAGNGSSFSARSGGNISFGSSTTGSKKARSSTRDASNVNFVAKSNYSNNAGSNSNDDGRSSGPDFRSVYVHPLSQILLEYLQDSHHEWVLAKGLDRSLTLHRDGSFELKYVQQPQPHASMSIATPTPGPSSATHKKDHPQSSFEPPISTSTSATAAMEHDKSNETKSSPPTKGTSDNEVTARGPSKSHHQKKHQQTNAASTVDNSDNIRIWTSYDEQEKKHWLTVRRGLFRQRFLLQDNLLTAWQGNRGTSLPERLNVAVDEMIRAVDRLDHPQDEQQATIEQHQRQQNGQQRFRKR